MANFGEWLLGVGRGENGTGEGLVPVPTIILYSFKNNK